LLWLPACPQFGYSGGGGNGEGYCRAVAHPADTTFAPRPTTARNAARVENRPMKGIVPSRLRFRILGSNPMNPRGPNEVAVKTTTASLLVTARCWLLHRKVDRPR